MHKNYETKEVEVDLEADTGVWLNATVRIELEHEGSHPFGTTRIVNTEVEDVIAFGNDGEEVKYDGSYDKQLIDKAKDNI